MQDPALADSEESGPGADDQRQCDDRNDPEHSHRCLVRSDYGFGMRGQAELAHAGNFDLDVTAVEVPLIEMPVAQFPRLARQMRVYSSSGLTAVGAVPRAFR